MFCLSPVLSSHKQSTFFRPLRSPHVSLLPFKTIKWMEESVCQPTGRLFWWSSQNTCLPCHATKAGRNFPTDATPAPIPGAWRYPAHTLPSIRDHFLQWCVSTGLDVRWPIGLNVGNREIRQLLVWLVTWWYWSRVFRYGPGRTPNDGRRALGFLPLLFSPLFVYGFSLPDLTLASAMIISSVFILRLFFHSTTSWRT